MNISIQKLLAKMEDQLKEAKASESESRIRERVHAIKSLCELILEQEEKGASLSYQVVQQPAITPQPSFSPAPQPIQQTQTQKLNTDEGNGDSLFDF
ncbi:YwdI family protein [Niallia sp. 01092]|uniref:YwdI family protein n=1 Tax=Niallia sp. 01092 TaxID=3457759 RepID=UPI003FD000F0